MTDKKEEILKKYQAKRLHPTVYGGVNSPAKYYHLDDVNLMLTEYADSQAKERSVGFANFIREKCFRRAQNKYEYENNYYEINELYTEYEIFTKQK